MSSPAEISNFCCFTRKERKFYSVCFLVPEKTGDLKTAPRPPLSWPGGWFVSHITPHPVSFLVRFRIPWRKSNPHPLLTVEHLGVVLGSCTLRATLLELSGIVQRSHQGNTGCDVDTENHGCISSSGSCHLQTPEG